MSTRFDVRRALQHAAEDLIGRRLTDQEADDLMTRFDRASGDDYDRTIDALSGQTKFSDKEIRAKASVSDNTDRLIDDVVQAIQDLKK